jgi:hypothetical protein
MGLHDELVWIVISYFLYCCMVPEHGYLILSTNSPVNHRVCDMGTSRCRHGV